MQYVNLAVRACTQRQRSVQHLKQTYDLKDSHAVKRDSSGQVRINTAKDSTPVCSPFGPHLVPVLCRRDDSPETKGVIWKDPEAKSSRNCTSQTQEVCSEAPRTELPSGISSTHQGKHECSPGLTHSRTRDGNSQDSEDCRESTRTTISTNDLLDCLVHPDVMARVVELLLERHGERQRFTETSLQA